MSRLTRDGTAEPVSRDQVLRHARGQENINFPCSADHEQDWQPYPVDPYSAICDDLTIHTYIHTFPKIPKMSLTLRLYSELSYPIYNHQSPLPSFASRIFMQSGTVSLYFGFSKNDLVS